MLKTKTHSKRADAKKMYKKNVILITVDCLRADFLGCIGGTNLTPNVDELASRSVLFSKAFANGPGTNQSFPAILTSTYFLMHDGFRLSPHYPTLAEILRRNRFKTVAFHSNPFLSKTFGWDRGFDEFYDFMDAIKSPSSFITRQQGSNLKSKVARFLATNLGASRNARIQHLLKKFYYSLSEFEIPYLEGKELNRQVFSWIEKHLDKSFFLWMHYMDPHYPYIPPEPYLEDFSSRKEAFDFNISADYNNPSREEIEIFRDLYKGEVRYIDTCIGELVEFLINREILEDSLVFFMADHGHAFMEHNKFGHNPEILYNEVLHVPLLIYGLGSSVENKFPVQLLDVSPTILDSLDIKKPPTFLGDNLLLMVKEDKDSYPIFSESAKPDLINLMYDRSNKVVSCIRGKWKLIINELLDKKELYNLGNDFDEKNNIIKNEEQISKDLTQLIKKHLSLTSTSMHARKKK